MILLDTVVLSELRKRHPSPNVMGWLRQRGERELYVSVMSIGEIERGIDKVGDDAFALALTLWLEELLRLYAERVLPVTVPIARRWGRLTRQLGHESTDLLIAATALCHGLTVASRNVRHYRPTGVAVVNPFDAAG